MKVNMKARVIEHALLHLPKKELGNLMRTQKQPVYTPVINGCKNLNNFTLKNMPVGDHLKNLNN